MSQPRSTDNVRVRRTRKLLRDALVELIEERGFDKATVAEITDRAMVSRAAFYRNYRDKYHLVEEIFDEAVQELLGTVATDDERPAQERWTGFFEHISAYHRFYGALLGRRGSPWFADRMRSTLSDMVTEHLRLPEAAGTTGLVSGVLAAMFAQSITWWLENDRPVPPGEIAVQSAQLAGAVIRTANSWTQATSQ